jgi:uncharacterized small protein (DUF1192 family)
MIKMLPLDELKKKIEKLQTERAILNDEIDRLKLEADEKSLQLQQEIGSLKDEANSLKEILKNN